jgi:hypothetical protein
MIDEVLHFNFEVSAKQPYIIGSKSGITAKELMAQEQQIKDVIEQYLRAAHDGKITISIRSNCSVEYLTYTER